MMIRKEKIKKMKLHPALVFLFLTIVVMIISSIGGILNLETHYYTVNTVSGDLENNSIVINNLFNRTGIQYLISNMLNNFITFAPLGTIILGLMGIGVAYKSEFLKSLNKIISKHIPRKIITFLIVLLGVIFSMFPEPGYVILIPLAAILFTCLERHPSAGICAAFAGLTFGYGANIFANSLDSSLSPYTISAIKILDKTYKFNINGNVILMIISSFIISYIGMIVTEKYIIPKLGKYNYDEEELVEIRKELTSKEKKGVIISILALIIILFPVLYCIIPNLPFSGLLLNLKADNFNSQLFGTESYFYQGSVIMFSGLLMFAGLIYGLRVKTIRNNRDFVDGMNYYLKDLSSILVLIFFAAQFCLIFKQTNIGIFLLSLITEFVGKMKLTGIALIFVTYLITAIANLLVPTSGTKWAILSPIIVPMFMQSSLTPEFSVAVFRAADSATKGITPLFTYFVILVGFLQIYKKKKNDVVTIKDALKLMIPYTIAYTVLWFVIILSFYLLGLPIGFSTSTVL